MFLENLFEVRFLLDFFLKVWDGIEHNSYQLLGVYCMPSFISPLLSEAGTVTNSEDS